MKKSDVPEIVFRLAGAMKGKLEDKEMLKFFLVFLDTDQKKEEMIRLFNEHETVTEEQAEDWLIDIALVENRVEKRFYELNPNLRKDHEED